MIKIFVEGKDRIFLETYIEILRKSDLSETKTPFQIINLGGWTNIKNTSNTFNENSDFGGINLVIFDADSQANNGGHAKRKEELEKIKKENNLTFSLFLFPNDESDGDFETLLETIINEKHSRLLKCFTAYEECIAKYNLPNSNPTYNLPIRKSKMYSYVDAFPKSRSEKEKMKRGDYFFGDPEIWDLYSSSLEPLKNFLLRAFSSSNGI